MTPIERAMGWHETSGCCLPFVELIAAHGRHGVVIVTPELFILARRIDPYWPIDRINDPWDAVPDGKCWHVWLAAGDWRHWEQYEPRNGPLVTQVSMHRRRIMRVYGLEQFRGLQWRQNRPPGVLPFHG